MPEIKVTDNATGYSANFFVPPRVRPHKINQALAELATGGSIMDGIMIANLKPQEAKFLRTVAEAWTEARRKHCDLLAENYKLVTAEALAAGKKPSGVKIFPDGKVELTYDLAELAPAVDKEES